MASAMQQRVSFPSYLQALSLTHAERPPQAGFKPEEPLGFQGHLTNAPAPGTAAYSHLRLFAGSRFLRLKVCSVQVPVSCP